MRFHPTPLPGAFVIEPEPSTDERGWFGRIFCAEEFEKYGLDPRVAQTNRSYTGKKGTLRGLHFQSPPWQENKLVFCSAGIVLDIIVDLRPSSPSFRSWHAVELSAESRRAVYVPEGFAHGYQTLTDDAELFYQISVPYHPECQGGVRWDDPTFQIRWPLAPTLISARDRSFPEFEIAKNPFHALGG